MWYVVQTISRQEQECLAVCRAKIDPSLYKEMFVPLYIDKMRFQKQWHDVKKVLFPGYFFVDTENIRNVAEELTHIDRFTKVLRSAGEIAPIRDEEQKFLQSMMNEAHIVECSRGMIIGDRVCITEGPLRNHYGFIRKVDRHRREARLEINFFGRMTPVKVGLQIVTKLTEEQFEKLKKDTLETYSAVQGDSRKRASTETETSVRTIETDRPKTVKIKAGVFAGLQGVLLSKNEKKDEWRVSIELFEHPTEVVFSGEEIEDIQEVAK